VARLLAATVLFAASLGRTNLALCERHPNVQKITGRIVAYSSFPACLNGNGYRSMLIRVQDRTTGLPPKFVEVQFSLPCAEHAEWLDRRTSVQQFRLRRQQDADSVLKEFYDCGDESTDKCPQMWRRVPGSDDEKLPFGQRVPSYRST